MNGSQPVPSCGVYRDRSALPDAVSELVHPSRNEPFDRIAPMEPIHATTVVCVRRDGKVAVAGDGQVTVGNTVMKRGAAKVRRLYNDRIVAGFAGSAADAFALFARFEG